MGQKDEQYFERLQKAIAAKLEKTVNIKIS
jgi:hypothetical protein